MMIPYSAMKIKANPAPPYSVLNPDTNSDSPSAKSKGVRLVSATHETTHTKIVKVIAIATVALLFTDLIKLKLSELEITINEKTISANLIS